MQNIIKRNKVLDFLYNQRGRFVTIKFVKKDGTVRRMNGRLGVVKGTKGKYNLVDRYDTSYKTMFDVQNYGFRNFNIDTVMTVTASQKVYRVID